MVEYERWLGVETEPATKTAHGIRSSDFACLHIVTLAVSVGGVGSSTGQRSDGLFYWCVMNYYAFHIGDYKAHTQHLTPMEDLIYRRMLDLYYLNESPLPDAQKIARSICLRDHISDIETILSEFFVDTPEGFIHARCEREIKAMNEKSGKAKASAQARWKKGNDANAMRTHSETDANASKNHANASNLDANALRSGCERNAPNTQYPIPNTKEKGEEDAHLFSDSDTRRFFTMPMDWNPSRGELQKYINGKIHDGKPLTLEMVLEHLADYREATHAKGEKRTESEWCRALVKWSQRCLIAPRQAQTPNSPKNGHAGGSIGTNQPHPLAFTEENRPKVGPYALFKPEPKKIPNDPNDPEWIKRQAALRSILK